MAAVGPVLSTRALNRATLARQLLLERVQRPALDVIGHLVGMQAQVPEDPYLGLWSRLEGFDPAELEGLLREKRVARSPLMRGTIHLATAADCLSLRPLMQPVLDRAQKGAFGRRLEGADMDRLREVGRALLSETPRTFVQLRILLGEDWARFPADAVTYSISYLVPLVQVPPRGLWSTGGQATWLTTEAWLGQPLDARPSMAEMVMRYLAAFGPATVNDIQAWCGLTRMREVVDGLRTDLLVFRDEAGKELFDLPDAPRPHPDTPAPPRFLPQYDNVFLAHRDRSRVITPAARELAALPNGFARTLLVDGAISTAWRLVRDGKRTRLEVTPFEPWPNVTRNEVAEEGGRLLSFLAPEAEAPEVVIAAGS